MNGEVDGADRGTGLQEASFSAGDGRNTQQVGDSALDPLERSPDLVAESGGREGAWSFGEDGRGTNGVWVDASSSLSSEEEEEEEEEEGHTASGYTLLPQEPEELCEEEGERVSDGHTQDGGGECLTGELQLEEVEMVAAGLSPVGVSPRLTRWVEREAGDLTRGTDRGEKKHEAGETGGVGGGPHTSVADSGGWAQFDEVVGPSGSSREDNWPPSSAPDTPASLSPTGAVQPSSTIEKGAPLYQLFHLKHTLSLSF